MDCEKKDDGLLVFIENYEIPLLGLLFRYLTNKLMDDGLNRKTIASKLMHEMELANAIDMIKSMGAEESKKVPENLKEKIACEIIGGEIISFLNEYNEIIQKTLNPYKKKPTVMH